jgi:hypothetical protein
MVKVIEMVERLRRVHKLILNKQTGCPDDFSKTIKVSKSQIFNYLDYIRDLGAEITYNNAAQSYEYTGEYIPEFSIPIKLVKKQNPNH